MSTKTVDQRVVEMRFDNRNFEKNVSTTMSSLDKLKQKLNFKGVTKGFENIDSASKKVNMNGLAGAVDTVRSRFSAMEVIGVTALANITNSAVNAGKRLVSALTIDPVKTGFSEYETQINAIQTILANTSSKGTTLEDVNAALDTLNTYADKTIYNFTEMTRNIGTFTAAGVDLNTSVNAIQGIANLAAVSGSTSQQASTAMYQLSQALASGTVKLMDWNSVVNAGMGGEVFQNALKETARVHGVAIDEIIEKNGSFRDSLHEEWLTTDILTETLEKFTMATEGMSEAEIEANKQKLKSIGYTEKQIEEIFELGNTATNAATKVKTFSQLWDTLKESAQSGWTQTWEIIVGDFEEAKSFLTTLSEGIGGFINKMSDWRNNLLEGALGSKWGQLTSKINEAGVSTEDFNSKFKKVAKEHGIAIDDLIKEHGSLENAISKCAVSADLIKETLKSFAKEATASSESQEDLNEKLEYFQNVVRKVWRGDYGNMEDRYKALTKAGYNYAEVQALVNKTVDGHELTLEDLTEAQLVSIGYTEEQAKSIKELADEAEKSGTPLSELIQTLDKPSGRTLLIESLKNAAQGLVKSFTAIKDAWVEIFPPMTSNTLYNIIAAVNRLSEHLRMGDETADKLKRTFKGLFALIDIIFSFIGGPVKIALKAVLELLGLADIPLLDLTAGLGDAIVKFRDWIKENNIFVKGIKTLIEYLKKAANGIKGWLDNAQDPSMGKNIIAGLIGGIFNGLKDVGRAALEIGKKIVNTVKEFLGIHSPSTVFMAIGGFIIAGLILGLVASSTDVWNTIKTIAVGMYEHFKEGVSGIWTLGKTIVGKLIEIFSSLNLERVLAIALGSGMFIILFKFLSVLGNVAKAAAGVVEGLGDMFEGLGDMFTGAGKMLKGAGRLFTSLAIVNIVIAIGLLVKALMSIVNSGATAGQLFIAVGVIATLGVLLTALYFVLGKIDDVSSISLKGTVALIGITGSLLILTIALSKLGTIDLKSTGPALALLAGILGIMVVIMAIMGKLSKSSADGEKIARKVGRTILAISVAMLLMLATAKIASKMSEAEIKKGIFVVAAFAGLIMAIVAVSKVAGKHARDAGKMIFKMSAAMLLMIAVMKLASRLSKGEINRGTSFVVLMGVLFTAILAVSRIAGKNADKAAKYILLMSIAMLAMVAVTKIASGLSLGEIKRGLIAVGALTVLFVALIAVSNLAGENAVKAGVMLLAMSGAMLAMVAVTFLLGQIDTGALTKGLTAVAVLGLVFAGLIAVTKLAKGDAIFKTLLMLTIAVALLGGLAIGMSFLDPSKLTNAAACMSMLVVAFAALVGITKFAKNTKQMIRTLLILSTVVLILAGILIGMSFLPNPSALIPSATALSVLMMALASSMLILGSAKSIKKGVLKTLAIMIAVVAALGLVLAGMSLLDIQNAIPNAIAMSVLLTVMTLLIKPLSMFGSGWANASKGAVALAAMAVPLALIGLVLAMMSALKVTDAMPNVIALSALLAVMTALLIPLTVIGVLGPTALWGVLALAAMAAPLALVGLVLAMMSAMKVQDALPNVKALSILLTVMTALLIPLTVIGLLGPAAMLGVGALTMMAIPLAAAVLVLAMMNGLGVTDAIDNVKALSTLLTVLTLLLIPLTLVGAAAPLAIAGIGTLITFITAIGAFMVAVGALTTWIPKIEEFMDKGVQVLVSLAEGIGSIMGAFVKGFSEQIMSGLPTMGQQLSDFMTGASAFIDGAKEVDDSVLKGAATLAGSIAALTVIDLYKSIFSSEDSFAKLGTELSNFMDNCKPFIEGAKTIDESAVAGVKALAETILVITKADILDGITSFFGLGEGALASFGKQLPQLGADIAKFSSSLTEAGLDESKLKMVETASSAIKILAEASSDIPNSGGWLGGIVGDNDLGVFADQFPKLGSGLRSFLNNIETFAKAELNTVDNACKALTSIATAAADIPNSGGGLGAIVGENDLVAFAKQFPYLGIGLRDFITNIGTFGEDQLAIVKNAAGAVAELAGVASKIPNAGGAIGTIVGENDLKPFADQFPYIGLGLRDFMRYLGELPEDAASRLSFAKGAVETLIGLANAVPNMGGIFVDLVGTNDLKTFANQFPNVGIGIRQFINAIGELTSGEIDSTSKAVEIIKSLTDLSEINGKDLKKNVDKIGDSLVSFAGSIGNFSDTMSKKGMKAVLNDTADGLRDLVNALGTISTEKATNLKAVSTSLKDLGTTGLKSFVEAFAGVESIELVKKAVKWMIDALIKAVDDKSTAIGEAFLLAAHSGYSQLTKQSVYDSFESAGKYLADGFAEGIRANAYKAINAAEAMVSAVNKKICAVALIKSPSKMTYEDGMFMVQGLVNALLDGTAGVDAAAEKLANSAQTGLTKAISHISDMIQNGIDTQPTIRPVLDLDDVRAGASQIGGMLSLSPSVGVLSNVRSIASAMGKRGQNGANEGVISELGKLRKDIAGLKHVSYNIEGINYGEGSEVAEAIETLVRAALMERRV